MKSPRILCAALGLALLACSGDRPADEPRLASHGPGHILRMKRAIPGEYIVKLKEGVVAPSIGDVHALVDTLATRHGGSKKHVFHSAVQGFSMRMSEAQALALSNDPQVEVIEENAEVEVHAVQLNAPWGLDRIDQRASTLDRSYDNRGLDGKGMTIYVIDSGIRTTHAELEGRATVGADFVSDGWNGQDAMGHGTHVAGIIAGKTWGVAKQANVVSVRVLDATNRATRDTVIAGIDWVTANHVAGAVANMSIGGTTSVIEDQAARNLVASGVVFVVSAGNDGSNGLGSPQRVGEVITVGAMASGDTVAGFSNYGAGVDLFAPGVDVPSAYNATDTSVHTMSGTSMAAPHVAGLAALYRQAMPTATPAQIEDAIVSAATVGKLANAGAGSPNRLAYIGNDVVVRLRDGFESGTSAWTVVDGTWSVVSDGSNVYQGTNSAGFARAVAGTALQDQIVEARVKPVSFTGTSPYVMVMGRYTNTANYYALVLRNTGTVELIRVKAGVQTTLASSNLTVATGIWYDVTLQVVGTALKGFVNGTLQVASSDSGLASGRVGLGVSYAQARFDDVGVSSPGAGTQAPTNPYPAQGMTAVDPRAMLAWMAGDGATSHDVYLGTGTPTFVANTTDTHYLPGPLANDTTYYWRIDEHTATGAVAQGPVWSFTTGAAPAAAQTPDPANGAGNLPSSSRILTWIPGAGATMQTIYFGTENPPPYWSRVSGSMGATIVLLDRQQTYYWRVDGSNASASTPGEVWTFSTGSSGYPDPATNPSPADGATNVSVVTGLSWTQPANVTGQTLDLTAAFDLSHSQTTTVSNLAGGSYTPPSPLFANTTYTWSVSEQTADGRWSRASRWSFTTGTPSGAPAPSAITSPSSGESGIGLTPTITWTAAAGATYYELYVRANGVWNVFTVASTNIIMPTLTKGTTYYAMIVSRNSAGAVRGGHVEFQTIADPTVPPPSTAARNPSPGDGASLSNASPTLSWTLGSGALSGALYLGTSPTSLVYQGEEADIHIARDLEPNLRYYWRVDSVNQGGRVQGPVWSFTTGPRYSPSVPTNPVPANGAVDVAPTYVHATWTEGSGTTSATIFWGTTTNPDPWAVLYPNTQQADASSSYDLRVAYCTTYYWRVLEKNQGGSTSGPLWSFSTKCPAPSAVTSPTPRDLATSVSPNLELSWGGSEAAHDFVVYLAPVWSPLTQASDHLQSTSFVPPTLLPNATYRWQVIATNAAGQTASPIWSFTTGDLNGTASNPTPADGTVGFSTAMPEGSWTAGPGCQYHRVSVGFDDPARMREVAMYTTFNGFGPLLDNTRYYWQVTAIDPADNEYPGPVWSFTTGTSDTLAGLPSNPSPATGAVGRSIRPSFTWTPGAGTVHHYVYLAQDDPQAERRQYVQLDLPFIPGYLQPNTRYRWFVGEENANGIRRGPDWFFTTGTAEANMPGPATNPTPAAGATNVATAPTLGWTSGAEATSHDVYLGTSNPPPLVGTQTATSYAATGLSSGTTYYWRVDERNADAVTPSPTWSFTTTAPVALFSDDFEDGNSNDWTVLGGTWSVTSDGSKVYRGSNTTGDARASAGSSAWANQTVSARIKPVAFSGTSRFVALFGRLRDASNYYYVTLRNSNLLELRKLVGGTSTVLASKAMTVRAGTWYTVKLELIGSALKVYVNGTQQLSATDSTFATGKIGLGTYYATASFDDVTVTQ